ncbi:MAG: metal-dependent transcriptional regulator [Eubacteriales bacterium]|nr:metal-dependent transcriptional regulator [Eubacteriales bacterium]
MALQESGEMYLETIYILSQKSPYVRSIDVAEYMNYSKPSVSRGMGLLKQGGYLTVDEDGYLHLTETGNQIAAKIYERHTVIRDMLIHLGVDEETAAQDACRIEHVISDKSFQAICRHAQKASPESSQL